MTGLVLAVDFGTSNTVAVLHRDGRPTPLLFDGSPLLPSAVYLAPDGGLLVGRDAERSAAVGPDRLEPHPKQRIDDGTVWLGERELPVVELVAAVLGRLLTETTRVTGEPVSRAVLTHPASWAGPRLAVLTDAARRAGLSEVALVAEPVAAAAYYATVLGNRVPAGRAVIVYDLGAGTFDVAVVQRTGEDGLTMLAADGLSNVGGLDLDAAIVGHLRATTGDAAEAWGRLDWPATPADRRARRLLWTDAREAKEQLSRHATAAMHIPLVDTDTHLTREEFERLAGPLLTATVTTTLNAVRSAGVGPESIAGLFLVGGGSRVPLAASLLHRALGIAPTVIEQPELAVATGAYTTPTTLQDLSDRPAAPPDPDPAPDPEPEPEPVETSFDMTWTGQEPIASFARRNSVLQWFWNVIAIGVFVVALLVDVPSDPIQTGLIQGTNEGRWFLVAVSVAIYLVGRAQAALAAASIQRRMKPWSLHIGPESITATDGAVAHRLPWAAIEAVSIGVIKANPLYQGSSFWPFVVPGLHIRFNSDIGGALSPVTGSPAGWPAPGGGPINRSDHWVPVCVLGPLTDQQTSTLREALIRSTRYLSKI